MKKRLVILAVVALLVVGLDQWSKAFVRANLQAVHTFAGGLLTVLRAENSGAFLSMGANLPPAVRTLIFSVFVSALLVMFVISIARGTIGGRGSTVAAAAIVGGGIGNLIDRIFRDGRVTDFLYLQAGPLHTGVFNVADIAITGAVLWLLAVSLLERKQEK